MMKKLFLASLAIAAFASCQKESSVDSTLTSGQQEMTFAPYAGASSTKGAPVNSNDDFKGTEGSYGSFNVAANFQATSTSSTSGSFFNFSEVKYNGSAWENQKDMYWPNEAGTIYFGAYYPAAAGVTTPAVSFSSSASFDFDYTVAADVYATANTSSTKGDVSDQLDLMYAMTSKELVTETNGSKEVIGNEDDVNLHFKHALTQVGFTATKDNDIEVTVSSIKICNVMDGGTFTATANTDDTPADGTTDADAVKDNFGSWSVGATQGHYIAALATSDEATTVEVTAEKGATDKTVLTAANNALMLIPQALTAWVPEAASSTNSYLAIACVIKHAPATDADGNDVDMSAAIVNGTIYVPFSTTNIPYDGVDDADNDKWLPGYKITYNLHFGGGYTIPGGTDPEPGTTPDPEDVVPTLRAITYTVTVDEWIPVAGGDVAL